MPRLNGYLSAADIGLMFDKVLTALHERGVTVRHQGVLKILSAAGAEVNFQLERVRFPRSLAKALLSEAPRRFTLAAAKPGLDLALPSPADSFYMCTNTGARNIIDPATGLYQAVTTADIKKWGRLVQGLENIDMCGMPTPSDVPPETAGVHGLGALLASTSKHIWVQPHSEKALPYLFELAIARCGGEDQFKKRPCVSFIVDSFTPLQFEAMDMEIILQSCRLGVPIHASSVPVMGGTSPITSVETVILAGIEVLALLLIAQAVRPGTPVLGLATSLAMDMQSGIALKASVEAMRTNAASACFIREAYGIPTHICGMTTDSFIPDGQALAERCLGGLTLAWSGVDIMGRAGELEAAKIISPALLAADNELAAMIKKLIAPLPVHAQSMAWEDLLAVEPGGHFLDKPSTLAHCREALRPALFKHQSRESWVSLGAKDFVERARQKALGAWVAPPDATWLAPDKVAELERIVRRADRSLTG